MNEGRKSHSTLSKQNKQNNGGGEHMTMNQSKSLLLECEEVGEVGALKKKDNAVSCMLF